MADLIQLRLICRIKNLIACNYTYQLVRNDERYTLFMK